MDFLLDNICEQSDIWYEKRRSWLMQKKITIIQPKKRTEESCGFAGQKLKVAAYCRVSTEHEEQQNSFENQVNYYTKYIQSKPEYEFAGIYADEGISGTSIRKREDFKRMIEDCKNGKIDLIIVKSISRFARNTQDCLNYSRMLKQMGVGVIFEKENINTNDGAGELLFTILSSLAQEESRSISENVKWGIRSNFKEGKLHINADRFLGYDKNENGDLIINEEQAAIVQRIFKEFMYGINPDVIAKRLNEEKVNGCEGEPKWASSTIWRILENEKYMGDAILQKTYTPDYLTKKCEKNDGHLIQYRVMDNHEAIVDKELWEAVQLEIERRKAYMKKYDLKGMGRYTDEQPFSNRVICGKCNKIYWRRTLTRKNQYIKVWLCGQRYREKGVRGCCSETIREEALHKAFVDAWNSIVINRENYMEKWKKDRESDSPLVRFRAEQMMELTKKQIKKIDYALVGQVLEKCVVHSKTDVDIRFLDGTVVEIRA